MGSVWAGIGLSGRPALLGLALLVPLLLVILGIRFIRIGKALQKGEPIPTKEQREAEASVQKRFIRVFAAEGFAILLAVNALANIGKSVYLIPTIGAIVGLHFLPLASIYRRRLFLWSGAVQILLCIGISIELHSDPNSIKVVTCVSMAILLWATMLAELIPLRSRISKGRVTTAR